MRWVACVSVVWLAACDNHDAKPRATIKHVDELEERDRGELIHLEGRASEITARRGSAATHLRFTLSHGSRRVTVVDKDVVPDLFREGVDVTVTGRWVHTADVRDGLDKEGFTDVRDADVFLARDVTIDPITFQF